MNPIDSFRVLTHYFPIFAHSMWISISLGLIKSAPHISDQTKFLILPQSGIFKARWIRCVVTIIAYMWCTKRLINGLDRVWLWVQFLLTSPSRVEMGRQGARPTGGRRSRKDTQPLDWRGAVCLFLSTQVSNYSDRSGIIRSITNNTHSQQREYTSY